MFKGILADIDSIKARDPAVRSRLEVLLCYPGYHAVLIHRLAHALWTRRWRLSARFISHLGRWLTGIEIHPGAKVGQRLFIDHGMGTVIGETAEIGDDVTLYHDVTLGGTAPSINSGAQVDHKRHPTLADNVIVGSGAQILGPITVGRCARVGANAVVVKDVPPNVTVAGIPARVLESHRRTEADFVAYGTPDADVPDPLVVAIEALRTEVNALKERLAQVEDSNGRSAESGSAVVHPLAVGERTSRQA